MNADSEPPSEDRREEHPPVLDSLNDECVSFLGIFCPSRGILEAGDDRVEAELRWALRPRLIVVSAILFLSALALSLRGYLFEDYTFPGELVTIAILAAATLFLYQQPNLSLKSLRTVEVVAFGIILIYMALYYLTRIEQLGAEPDAASVLRALYRLSIAFLGVIMAYGIFIPNHWRRATLVVASMLVVPSSLIVLVSYLNGNGWRVLQSALTPDDLSYLSMVLLLGVFASVLGSYVMQTLRQSSAEARQMGMYQLIEKIGGGGMGDVWKAEHKMLARPAAVKIIKMGTGRNGHDQATTLSRFKREAKITASLRSPHTVELYDFGVTQNGVFYYVMEYLDGLNLEELVEGYGPLPPERAMYLLRQVGESLSEAHDRGLIHRDIKPSNIYVSRMGVSDDFIKVLDFGLVTFQKGFGGDETRITVEGMTTGTPAYMPPELALGKQEVDVRSDIYSLGCVGYWLLTGLLVFEGETPIEIVANHIKTEPVPPSARSEFQIPPCLDDLIMACLAKKPEDRIQSLSEFIERLDRCKADAVWTPEKARHWWDAHRP